VIGKKGDMKMINVKSYLRKGKVLVRNILDEDGYLIGTISPISSPFSKSKAKYLYVRNEGKVQLNGVWDEGVFVISNVKGDFVLGETQIIDLEEQIADDFTSVYDED
jgi:hypothetical protein